MTVVLGACGPDVEESLPYGSGGTSGDDGGTTDDDTETGEETDTYGTDGAFDEPGDGGYFDHEQSADDVDLER